MEFLQQFTATVLGVAFLCFFSESLVCAGPLSKYVSLVTGLVVSVVVVSAFLQIRQMDWDALSIEPTDAYALEETNADAVVAAQFAQKLVLAVEQSVQEAFSQTVRAEADVYIQDHTLMVRRLTIYDVQADKDALKAHIREEFGLEADYG